MPGPSPLPDRRQLLRAAAVAVPSLLNLQFSGPLRAAPTGSGKAKAVVFLHQFGGPSQLETLDPKPVAPEGIRGIFGASRTAIPGVQLGGKLPNLARVLDKVCLVRSLHHSMKHHNSAAYYGLTGHVPPFDDQRLKDSLELYPAYGSVVDKLAPATSGMPTFVALPHQISDGSVTPGQHASFLGQGHNPLFCGQDPNHASFRLAELSLPANVPFDRLQERRAMMRLIDRQSELFEASATAHGFDENYDRALGLMTSTRLRQAFDLASEPAKLRDKYGHTTFGQSCLLARRLVESGAKFINVYFAATIGGKGTGGWDTHGFDNVPMQPVLDKYLLPITDQVVPAFLDDLDARGLLESTLVVWVGEFGRSPRINPAGGRDHWPNCYSALLAGGGVKRGFVYGSSEKDASAPVDNPARPEDLSATIFHQLGLEPDAQVPDALKRPVAISSGTVMSGLLA